MYLNSVKKFSGYPTELVTNLGRENGILASIRLFSMHPQPPENTELQSCWKQSSYQLGKCYLSKSLGGQTHLVNGIYGFSDTAPSIQRIIQS